MSAPVETGDFNFRFRCEPGCTACCTNDGDVYLTAEDVERLAVHFAVTREEFERAYCETVAGELRLTIPEERGCHFLLDGACAVHEAKPVQCRTFPFWPENVKSKRVWKRLSRYCPGVGVGQILPLDEVRRQAQECADAFPEGELRG